MLSAGKGGAARLPINKFTVVTAVVHVAVVSTTSSNRTRMVGSTTCCVSSPSFPIYVISCDCCYFCICGVELLVHLHLVAGQLWFVLRR